MGVSTDAILCWGIHLPDEEDREDDVIPPWVDGDMDGVLCEKMSGPKPPPESKTDDDRKAYWKTRSDFLKGINVEVFSHCSGDYPMYIIAITESKTVASRGYPETIKSLRHGMKWDQQLRAVCDVLGIKWEPPKWILCSDWY